MQFAVIASILIGIFMILAGAAGVIAPVWLISMVLPFISPVGLKFAVAFRLFFAAMFWLAAPASRAPLALQALAVLLVVSALAIAVMGPERIAIFVDWWLLKPQWVVRAMSAGGVLFGGVVLWLLWR